MPSDFENTVQTVLKYLESCGGVTSVQHTERPPATQSSIDLWESKNSPYVLPDDYKSYLLLSNGLLIRWMIEMNDEKLPIGCMQLNPIKKVKRINVTKFSLNDRDSGDQESSDEDEYLAESKQALGSKIAAFDIDSSCRGGRIGLLYRGSTKNPQIWFQALSCKWFFVAENFTNYFRLMIMHLGISYWWYAFTDMGLDPVTKQWLRLVIPERLEVDKLGSKKVLEDVQDNYDFNDDPSRTKEEWKMPRAVVKINLKKLDKYAKQQHTKGNRRKIRSKNKGDDDSSPATRSMDR
mmetsp:Transcript_8334/g.15459  ORF Transcript_8334/g.15459 Transcript_8334/m.15459 type:complete len:293 (+) Transcript_8334:58-936(+)